MDPNNYQGVTQRTEKAYQLNATTSLPEIIIESFWDPVSGTKKLLKQTHLTYRNQKVVEEAIFDADGVYRYTIYTDYNHFGQITRRTTPLGHEKIYQYNHLGLLVALKEPGTSKKI